MANCVMGSISSALGLVIKQKMCNKIDFPTPWERVVGIFYSNTDQNVFYFQ